MTMTLKAQVTETAIRNGNKAINNTSAIAVDKINSLGGRPLPAGQNTMGARVALENFASADINVWQLNVVEQILRHRQPKTASTLKQNPYMSR